MDITALEVVRDGIRVQLNSGTPLIMRAERLVF